MTVEKMSLVIDWSKPEVMTKDSIERDIERIFNHLPQMNHVATEAIKASEKEATYDDKGENI